MARTLCALCGNAASNSGGAQTGRAITRSVCSSLPSRNVCAPTSAKPVFRPSLGKVAGEVLLRNTGGAWGVDEELIDLVIGG